ILALWIVFAMLRDIQSKTANKPTLVAGLRSLTVSYWGMTLAHLGFVLTMAGACLTSIYSIERSVLLQPGQSADLGRYTFQLEGTRHVSGPNFEAEEATIAVSRDGQFYKNLYPQKRLYTASGTPTSQ